jgi:GST-like protein
MIDFYGMGSPNVLKVAIMLEEIGQPYSGKFVSLMHSGDDFLALNPMGKVPVIVDHGSAGTGQPIFESGAILIYLAETYHSSLLPTSGPARWDVLQWLMVQMSSVGPMLGQVNHFQLMPSEADSYAAQRYRNQAARIYRNLDNRLGIVPWLGGQEYSIADIAVYPWSAYLSRHGFDMADYPNLIAWRETIDQRPAVKRAVAAISAIVAAGSAPADPPTVEQVDHFFCRPKQGPVIDMEAYFALGPMTTAQE